MTKSPKKYGDEVSSYSTVGNLYKTSSDGNITLIDDGEEEASRFTKTFADDAGSTTDLGDDWDDDGDAGISTMSPITTASTLEMSRADDEMAKLERSLNQLATKKKSHSKL
jgi:hypothetical protein